MSVDPHKPDDEGAALDLRFARADPYARLRDELGAPVWPCVDDADEVRLAAIAGAFGGRAVRALHPAAAGPSGGSGVVVGTGDEVEPIGRLYAHLTGRSYLHAASAGDAARRDGVEVILQLGATAPHDVLDELVGLGRNASVGVLWASEPDVLRRQALVRAAAVKLAPSLPGRGILISPTAGPIGRVEIGSLELYGALHAIAEIEDAEPRAVLALTTHSDGIDAFLGQHLTLCALTELLWECEQPAPKPKCILTGECHRQSMPIREAMTSGRLVPASRITGRAVIWNSCFGIMGQTSTVVDSWGVLPRLLASPHIGCLVVLRAIVNAGTSAVVPLVADLQRGAAIHAALASWQATLAGTPGEMISRRVFVFGDPAVVVNPRTTAADPAVAGRRSGDLAPCPQTAEGALIRRFLADVGASRNAPTNELRQCEEAVDAFELETASATTFTSYLGRARALRLALLAVLTRTNWSAWTDSWMHAATLLRILPGTRCANCAAETWAALYQPRPAGAATRYYANCAKCGAVDDHPEFDHAIVSCRGEQLLLHAGGPSDDWTGALVSVPIGPGLKSIPWPAGDDGRPVRECDIPETGHVGPIFRVAIFIQDWRVSLFMRRVYVDVAHASA